MSMSECMYAHKTRGVSGGAPPGNFFEIRCSEVASGAIFGQKQSC